MKNRKMRFNLFGLDDAIVAAIIGAVAAIVVAIIGYSAATYSARHPKMALKSGITLDKVKFEKSEACKTSQAVKVSFSADGNVYWSGYQEKGSNSSKYRVNYKLSTEGSYKNGVPYSVSKGIWSKDHKIAGFKKKKYYNLAVTKTSNLKQKTVVTIDVLQK